MAETLFLALYGTAEDASLATEKLMTAGVPADCIDTLSTDTDEADPIGTGEGFNAQTGAGAVEASLPLGKLLQGSSSVVHFLESLGLGQEEAASFEQGLHAGGTLMVARLSEQQAELARSLLLPASPPPATAGQISPPRTHRHLFTVRSEQ